MEEAVGTFSVLGKAKKARFQKKNVFSYRPLCKITILINALCLCLCLCVCLAHRFLVIACGRGVAAVNEMRSRWSPKNTRVPHALG